MSKRRKEKNSNKALIVLLIIFIIVLMILVFFDDIKNAYDSMRDNETSEVDNDKDNDKTENNKDDEQLETEDKKDNINKEDNDKNPTDEELLEQKNDPQQQQQHESINKIDVNIELIGDRRITLKLNDKYVEYGAKAYDSEGKDISSSIKIDNAVDTSRKGKYLVIYYIGNSTAVRTVVVE